MPGPADQEFFIHHFSPWDQRFPDGIEDAVSLLHDEHPVTWSDAWGGFWMVSSYQGLVDVWKNWRSFSSGMASKIAPLRPGQPVQPPINVDPPVQLAYRQLLNPFFTPGAVASFEPSIRALVTDLIDAFIEDGHCDLVDQFASEFPGRMLYRCLLNVDEEEVPKVSVWTRKVIEEPTEPDTAEYEQAWVAWIYDLIDDRRRHPRPGDVVDALLNAEIEGEKISDLDIMGVIFVLIIGGFETTSGALANAMYRLAEDTAFQDRLRTNPSEIGSILDEFFRIDPPVAFLSRVCVEDTEVEGQMISAGERIGACFTAANRDRSEFANPCTFDPSRSPNRHVSFGLGVHRCIGSNVARLNLRVALEELLGRLGEFRTSEGFVVERHPQTTWGMKSLPIEFSPGIRFEAD